MFAVMFVVFLLRIQTFRYEVLLAVIVEIKVFKATTPSSLVLAD
jgi:hypothetical protein